MKMLRSWMIAVLIGLPLAGCGSDRGPSSPTPTDITGTWTGFFGTPGSGTALRVTWLASQSGSSVGGSMTLVKPMANVPATGPLSGTLSGSLLSLSYVVPAGSVNGYASCSISGNGTGTLSGSTITGTMSVTFTSCDGVNSGLAPPAASDLSLTKQ